MLISRLRMDSRSGSCILTTNRCGDGSLSLSGETPGSMFLQILMGFVNALKWSSDRPVLKEQSCLHCCCSQSLRVAEEPEPVWCCLAS